MIFNTKLITIILFSVTVLVFGENPVVTVKKGDTLYQISREYNVSVTSLLNFNNISSADKLKIGQKIRIPSLLEYTVKRGDTLYGIAARYDISLEDLLKLNGIEKDTILKTGDILLVSGKEESGEDQIIIENREEKTVSESSESVNFFWPHSGVRVSMDGKLKGAEFLGEKGDKIVSVSTGKVVWVAPYRGYGRLIMVEAADHHIYAYGGNEETFVKVGDKVLPGTALGLMGIDSIEKNAKAYFFVYKDGKPVEPDKAPRG